MYETRHTDSSRLNQEREGLLEFGNCLRGMAIAALMCFMDRTVCRTTSMIVDISHKFHGLIFRGSHLTTQNMKITHACEECQLYSIATKNAEI